MTSYEHIIVLSLSVVALVALLIYIYKESHMARKPLNNEQLKLCLEAKGEVCPCCGEDDVSELTFGSIESDDDVKFTRKVSCDTCNQEWNQVFTLTSVERYED